jgi:hypothetical protein
MSKDVLGNLHLICVISVICGFIIKQFTLIIYPETPVPDPV